MLISIGKMDAKARTPHGVEKSELKKAFMGTDNLLLCYLSIKASYARFGMSTCRTPPMTGISVASM